MNNWGMNNWKMETTGGLILVLMGNECRLWMEQLVGITGTVTMVWKRLGKYGFSNCTITTIVLILLKLEEGSSSSYSNTVNRNYSSRNSLSKQNKYK
jgi:hypothetical protein